MIVCVLNGGAQLFTTEELRRLVKILGEWQNLKMLKSCRAELGRMLKRLWKLYPNVLGAQAKIILNKKLLIEPNLDRIAPRSITDALLSRLIKL